MYKSAGESIWLDLEVHLCALLCKSDAGWRQCAHASSFHAHMRRNIRYNGAWNIEALESVGEAAAVGIVWPRRPTVPFVQILVSRCPAWLEACAHLVCSYFRRYNAVDPFRGSSCQSRSFFLFFQCISISALAHVLTLDGFGAHIYKVWKYHLGMAPQPHWP